ncbi:MAG: trigger factor [Candidatus Yanofskybacteria bacterium RIFCSPHIGHO2_02_FULL_38_22b]|uniref:Trigger factor n=1 Tax=Candidatus Yanofskybacteria bacterium RIFCSPHIGHO2_02_FULL_38_22b TaxID=1802673 RepID=A0A1F8EZM7_9BACT|nr:MAG: trigger factor [Candidatus Yanofskybacteria bacterium RIFCSPHIGHO2_01_FULL_39_44]OGN06332.1 MAG: trigger factor [Candidatus Yanofskybacteria bacterium RIFCSPHIGHO2_02_FULL_38_22b]OGN19750.1 MAG: trigger factor [Candidatus Yanofskybacteria bacterium RIFCSPLOWO2_01_FULL_39_28]
MESTLKKLEQNRYELTVEVGHDDLKRYVQAAEDKFAKEIKVDGFRQGKVPRDKVRQEVGNEGILEEGLNIALQDSLAKTLEKEGLEVLKVSDLKIKENSASKLLYIVNLLIFPPVTFGNLIGFKVKKKEVSVDKKEIDDALEFIRISRSKFIRKHKSIEKGDRAEVDFEVTQNGLPIEGGVSKNHPVVVGDNKFIPGFEDQLLGMKEGEEKKFSLIAPKDYFHKAVAGKELDFEVKVIKVEEIQKPALSDEFARSLGQFEGLHDLERNVSEGILDEKKNKEQQRLRIEILSGILAKSKIDLPKDMINERLNEMVVKFDNDLHLKGMELSIHLAHLNKTEDDLRKDWRPEAEKQVAFALILKKIAKDNNIKPTPEEIEEMANNLIQAMTSKGEVNPENINLANTREAALAELTNEKVFEFLEKRYSV